jgi:hypothetical protein
MQQLKTVEHFRTNRPYAAAYICMFVCTIYVADEHASRADGNEKLNLYSYFTTICVCVFVFNFQHTMGQKSVKDTLRWLLKNLGLERHKLTENRGTLNG